MSRKNFGKLLSKYTPEVIIEKLSPFLTVKRRERIDTVLASRIGSVGVAMQEVADIHNAMAALRTAEGLGAHRLHLIGASLKNRRGRRSSMGSVYWTEAYSYPTLQAFQDTIQDYKVAAATLDGEYELDDLPIDKPLILLFGNEREGLTQEAIESADYTYTIPMHGMAQSFNLSVSAAISLYTTLKRRRAFLKSAGDLSAEEIVRERAWAFVHSMGLKKSEIILRSL